MLISSGIPSVEDLSKVIPPEEVLTKHAVAIIECFQCIPCNPCVAACPQKAIIMEGGINSLPKVIFDKCSGCGVCITKCPGLAIFVVDNTYTETESIVKIPFEFSPLPHEGQLVNGLSRDGQSLGWFKVIKVMKGIEPNLTSTIWIRVPRELSMILRNIKVGGYKHVE